MAKQRSQRHKKQTMNRNYPKRVNKPPFNASTTHQTDVQTLLKRKNEIVMDARTLMNLKVADPSAETRRLIARWRDTVKSGFYCQSGGRWKKYHEQKFFS